MKLFKFRTLGICLLFGLLCFDVYAQSMYANKLTVRNRFILDGYEINGFENDEQLSGNTRDIPTSYAVKSYVDSTAGLRTLFFPFTLSGAYDTVSIKASCPIFVVPPALDSFYISAAYAAGDTDVGSCSIQIRLNDVPVDTLASVDTSGIVTSTPNILVQSGDVITYRIFGISGFLVGLGITLLLTP